MKRITFVMVLALVLVSVGTVFAGDGPIISVPTKDYGNVPMINDGRLNGFDLYAPVAVFYKYDKVRQTDGKDLMVLRGIELLGIEQKSNNGFLVLSASVDKINAMIADANGKDCCIVESNGYSLHFSQSGWFWVVTPPDREGKVYTFKWENFTVPVG
jgi:hypothetical protein